MPRSVRLGVDPLQRVGESRHVRRLTMMLGAVARAIRPPRMAERRSDWQLYGLGAAALLTGTLLFWLSLHCDALDWYISETHADVIYTGLRQFGEFPYFSFVFNGGTYFLQDGQSNLFSPAVPLILLAGPSIGLRLMEGLWGVIGVYAFVGWMRRRVSFEAALVGGVASTTGLGVLWRVAVGNDMFLWHLGLPLLLWAADRVLSERTLNSALWFALGLGALMLGPTFCSFTYLFIPVVPLYVLVELSFQRSGRRELGKISSLFALACALALLMNSIKLAAWLTFPMQRPVGDFGVLPLWSSIQQLFDYSRVQNVSVAAARYAGKLGGAAQRGWGVWESSTALPPVATLFAALGLVTVPLSKHNRRLGVFAVLALLLGLVFTSWAPAWEAFRRLNGGNFRVAQRCLGMSSFAVSVFASLGAEFLFGRWRRAARPLALGVVAAMLGCVIWWTHSASRTDDGVVETPMNPIEVFAEERSAASKVRSFDTLRSYRGQRDILTGTGYTDGFSVVGSEYRPKLWASRRVLPVLYDGHANANVGAVEQSQISTEHLRIKIRTLPPHSRTFLRIQEPNYGLAVTTTPANAQVNVRSSGDLLLVENPTAQTVDRAVLRARFPISFMWPIVSGVALVATIAGLCWFAHVRRLSADKPNRA